MRSRDQLLDVIDALYEGALDDSHWEVALRAVNDAVSGVGLALFSMNPESGHVHRGDVVGFDPAVMRTYNDAWLVHDPRHAASLTCAVGEPQVDGMLVATRDFHRTAIFNDFLKPVGCPYHVAAWVERGPTRGVVLTVQGPLSRGVFDEQARLTMAALIPHVRRAVKLKDRLAAESVTADGLLEVMDRLPFGVLLLADNLQILESSASAAATLALGDGLLVTDRRLGFTSRADARAFAERLGEDPILARLDDSVSVQRTLGRSPLSLLVMPAMRGREPWLGVAARWIVLVFDAENAPAMPERMLQRTLGITRAEAALARRLALGLSVAESAAQLEISLNTARAQLKSIYAKTGVSTQAQLVRRIFTSPALLGGHNPSG